MHFRSASLNTPLLLSCALLSACAGDDSASSEATSESASGSAGSATSVGSKGGSASASETMSTMGSGSTGPTGSTDSQTGETGETVGTTEGGSTSGGEVVPVTVLNGSFEMTSLEPGCHSNLSNEEFSAVVEHVTAFGELDQTDLYSDCFGTTADGLFRVALGADGQASDAIALELSGPLDLGAGGGYRLLFIADHGATGGATSTNVLVGVSSDPTSFGVQVGESGLLSNDPSEYEFLLKEEGPTYITLQVEVDGDLGWAMIDDVRLELVD